MASTIPWAIPAQEPRSRWLGAKAAWRALGDQRGATAYAATKPATRPFHPFGRPHFLLAANLWYRHVVDPLQDRAAS